MGWVSGVGEWGGVWEWEALAYKAGVISVVALPVSWMEPVRLPYIPRNKEHAVQNAVPPPGMGCRCVCAAGTVRHKAEVQSKSQRVRLFSDMS